MAFNSQSLFIEITKGIFFLGLLKTFLFVAGAVIYGSTAKHVVVYDVKWRPPCRFYQRNATFTLFWIYIGFTSFKGSYKRLFRRTVIDQEPKYLYFRGPLGKQVTFDTSDIYVNTLSQWRSSNLFSLTIQGETRTFELTD